MRFSPFIFFVFFSVEGIAQTPEVIKISSVKLHPKSNLSSVKNLVSDLKDCSIDNFKLTFSLRGAMKEYTIPGEFFSAEARQIIGSFSVGQTFFIEDIKSNCSARKSYTLQVN